MIILDNLINMFKQITTSAEPKIIGVTNGVYQLEFKDVELRKNSNYKKINDTFIATDIDSFLKNQNQILDLKIEYLTGKLLKKAKLTDIIAFSPYFFGYKYIVSQKFVDCLEEGRVDESEYHLRKIEIVSIKEAYYLFFVPMISSSEIDFKKSLIYPEKDFLSESKNYFDVNNYKEYCELLKNSYFNKWEKIVLNQKYKNRSIINLQASIHLFFSESLVKILKKRKISNLVIKEDIELLF